MIQELKTTSGMVYYDYHSTNEGIKFLDFQN